jgi:hypothetical protein
MCLLLTLLLMSGCSFTQPPFIRIADDIGGTFSAAATTLTYFHQGKLSRAYTLSSFAGYESELADLGQQFSSQQGAPGRPTIQHLLALYQPAMRAIRQPCLNSSCDWRGQVTTLERASRAFIEVSEA